MAADEIFRQCVLAVRDGILIERDSRRDKEFHFQNWFQARLETLQLKFDTPGRNSYPDFRLVDAPEGYELKGLAYPGREANYDANSQLPCGIHNGRRVYYVFGRYPKEADGDKYPVLDLVICHGSFLNADNDYEHKNTSFRGFGSYGDILVRDRKMYVAPTPFALVDGLAHRRTLILSSDGRPGEGFQAIGELVRREVAERVVAYEFDFRTNQLRTTRAPNPSAGREHRFTAYRVLGDPTDRVSMRDEEAVLSELGAEASRNDDGESE